MDETKSRQPLLVAVAALGAILPVAVAGTRAALGGWMPAGELAFVSVRASDVFTTHPPMFGAPSSASGFIQESVHHPGPLELFAIAPWIQVFGVGAGTALGITFVNIVSVLTVAWLAFRRAGQTGCLLATAAMATLAWSLGSERLYDAWPPHATLFPFVVVLVAAWSVADRDRVALPVLAVSASYVVQTHVGFALLAPGVLLVAAGLYGRQLFRRPDVRWLGGSVALTVLLWLPPLFQQLTRGHGNLGALWDASQARTQASVPFGDALRLFAGTVALPPWWLPPSFGRPAVDTQGEGVALWLAAVAALVLFAAVGFAAVRARRRGRSAVAAGLCLLPPLFGLLLLTVDQAVSLEVLPVPSMYTTYLWGASAFTWTVVALAVVDRVPQLHRGVVVLGALTPVVGLLAVPVADRGTITTPEWASEVTPLIADAVIPRVEGTGPVLLEMPTFLSSAPEVGGGVMAELVDAGVPFLVRDPGLIDQVGRHRKFWARHAELRIAIVAPGVRPPGPDAELVLTTPGLTADDEAELAELYGTLPDVLDDCADAPRLAFLASGKLSREEVHAAVAGCDALPLDDLDRYVHLAEVQRNQTLRVFVAPVPRNLR